MKQKAIALFLLFFTFGCKDKKEVEQPPITVTKAMCAPVTTDRDWYQSDNKAPLFEGLGELDFSISTENSLVQKYFDQGLLLAYGFNHAEAARSFYYATRVDPDCAMAHWGYAYVLGPNYNAGMESDNYERAYEAIMHALAVPEDQVTPKERALIVALAKRYTREPIEDRYHLDVEYSKAMSELYEKYPEDGDIGTLYAESLMNLHPWDLYDKAGNVKEWTPSILNVLESVIEKHPKHCGAHHFYIHAVEASDAPDQGLASAGLFDEGITPNSGHLVHMSSHIYIRTGDYHKGTLANINAIKVDSNYVTACHAQGAYPLAYYPHNQHFMAGTATLEGNSKWALYASDAVSNNANRQLMKEPGWGTIQHYYSIPFYVYVKFGKWDEILSMKNDVPDLEYPSAALHYAKGMAFLGKGNINKARQELKMLSEISSDESLKEVTIWDINTVYDLVQIAGKVLEAEIFAVEKKYSQSILLLREAIEIEDALNYNEPPDWFFSVRHHLGAIQLDAGMYKEAIITYEEDLDRLPKNGWALKGLSLAYKAINHQQLGEVQERFDQAWATADIELNSSVVR